MSFLFGRILLFLLLTKYRLAAHELVDALFMKLLQASLPRAPYELFRRILDHFFAKRAQFLLDNYLRCLFLLSSLLWLGTALLDQFALCEVLVLNALHLLDGLLLLILENLHFEGQMLHFLILLELQFIDLLILLYFLLILHLLLQFSLLLQSQLLEVVLYFLCFLYVF